MREPYETYIAREAALNAQFRGIEAPVWADWHPPHVQHVDKVPPGAERASLGRTGSSHRGIGGRKALKFLAAQAVNQDYLDEICTIAGLERLELGYPVTATDLRGLRSLTRLRFLRIDSPRNVADFSPLLDLPALRTLFVENAKHMVDIGWLAGAHHLEVIGIEGSMWTRQKVPGLRPLAGLRSLRAFFATSVRLGDRSLAPLAECPALEFLSCAKFAPQAEFQQLERMKPGLVCYWFRPELWDERGR